MEECVILEQGQECSMDRFSPTKRALTIPGMAEPRGQGGGVEFGRLVYPSQPRGQFMPPYITTRPPDFQTFRHPCVHRVKDIFMKFSIMKFNRLEKRRLPDERSF